MRTSVSTYVRAYVPTRVMYVPIVPPSGTVVPCARPGRESPNGQGTRLPEMGTGRVSGGVGLSDHRLAGVTVRRRARDIAAGFLYRATLHVCMSTRRVHGSVRARPDRQHFTLLGQDIHDILSTSAPLRNTAVSAPHHTQHCVAASHRHGTMQQRSEHQSKCLLRFGLMMCVCTRCHTISYRSPFVRTRSLTYGQSRRVGRDRSAR